MTDEISVVNNVIDTSAPILKIAHITDDDASTIILVFNEEITTQSCFKSFGF